MKGFYGYEERRIEKISPVIEITPELEPKIRKVKKEKYKRRSTKLKGKQNEKRK